MSKGMRSGEEHHTRRLLAEAKASVLERVRSGLSVEAAFALTGRNPRTLETWLKDARWAAELEAAHSQGQVQLEQALGDSKFDIDFATFSKEFLGLTVFPHHQDWVDVLEGRAPRWIHPSMIYEPAETNRLLINVPPEHAKSTVITVGYATYLIAMNPNIRIVIVSKTQTRAKEFLYSIKQRLTEERWAKMQQVYGPANGYKATSGQWTDHRIYLERDSGEKDPTVQALGIGQQIYGTRADVIIVDDAVDTGNAHEYEKQMNWLQKMAITRLGKFGKIIVVGTRVSSIDFYKEIRNPDRWSGDKTPFTYFAMPAVLEFDTKPEKWVTLWPESDQPWDGDPDPQPNENGLYWKWDGPSLRTRRAEVSPATWAMVYQQQDIEDDSVFPPEAVNGSVNRMRKPGPLRPGNPGHPTEGQFVYLMGIDPAMVGKTAAIMYAVDRYSGKRYIVDAFNMSDPTPQKIRTLIEEWVDKYNPMELIIEINAFQKAFALDDDLNQWLSGRGVRLREHFTGNNKWDVGFGVASMSGLFGTVVDKKHRGNNLIELPDTSNEHFKALVLQLITWKADTKNPTDLVMALWFCELRAKELIKKNSHKRSHIYNRFATRRNVEQQTAFSLNDLASEPYYA